jgi:hypothetical protein
MGVREIMAAMECVVKITYSGQGGHVVSEVGSLQRKIMDAFGLVLEI